MENEQEAEPEYAVHCGCDCGCARLITAGNRMAQRVPPMEAEVVGAMGDVVRSHIFLIICADCYVGAHKEK